MRVISTDQDAIQFFKDNVECSNTLFKGINFQQSVLERFLGGYYNLDNVVFLNCTFREDYLQALPRYKFKFKGTVKIQGCTFENMPIHFISKGGDGLVISNSKFSESSIVLKGWFDTFLMDNCESVKIHTFFTVGFNTNMQIMNSTLGRIVFDGVYPSSESNFKDNTLNLLNTEVRTVKLAQSSKFSSISGGSPTLRSLFSNGNVKELLILTDLFSKCDFSNISFSNTLLGARHSFVECNMTNADLRGITTRDLSFVKCKGIETVNPPEGYRLKMSRGEAGRYELIPVGRSI